MVLAGPPRSHEKELPPRLFSHQCLEGEFCEHRHDGVLRTPHSPDPIRQALRRAYRGPGAWDDHQPPNAVTGVQLVYGRRRRYLRLVARLSEALDVTEVAYREARRLLDCL